MEERQDTISRQAAIDALAKFVPYAICDESTESYTNGLTDAYNLICQLPSAQSEHRWIPCSERLPEKGGQYLVTRGHKSCGNLWNRVYIVNYSDLMGLKKEKIWWSGNVGKSDFEKYDDVIAWMPLPEPYNAETK